jgi:hypothetical protein
VCGCFDLSRLRTLGRGGAWLSGVRKRGLSAGAAAARRRPANDPAGWGVQTNRGCGVRGRRPSVPAWGCPAGRIEKRSTNRSCLFVVSPINPFEMIITIRKRFIYFTLFKNLFSFFLRDESCLSRNVMKFSQVFCIPVASKKISRSSF